MNNKVKNMQDTTPNDVICVLCRRIIIPGYKVNGYRERDIEGARNSHQCEELKDFKDKV